MKHRKLMAASLATIGCLIATAGLHPANVPSARVQVSEKSKITVHLRFDILAFCIDATPTEASDGSMEALLNGNPKTLQARLDAAKSRLKSGIKLQSDRGPLQIDSITFPTATDIVKAANRNGRNRLPVMLTVKFSGNLPAKANSISSAFPEVLDSVVVTTEIPYQEPIFERVAPGVATAIHAIPNAAQLRLAKDEYAQKIHEKAKQ